MNTKAANSELVAEYTQFFNRYAESLAQEDLSAAEMIGCRAMACGVGLIDISSFHQAAVRDLAACPQTARRLAAAQEFFRRALAPYERALDSAGENEKLLCQLDHRVEMEAQRIAHSLHDDAGQMLVSLYGAIEEMTMKLHTRDRGLSERALAALEELEEHLRDISHELRPTLLDDLGLAPALHFLADGVSRRRQISVDVRGDTKGRLPREVETAGYRICQEALNNAGKHASASAVEIEISRDSEALICAVEDNGAGFDVTEMFRCGATQGLGLRAMRTRAAAVRGHLEIWSGRGSGTRVEFRIPIAAAIFELAPQDRPSEPTFEPARFAEGDRRLAGLIKSAAAAGHENFESIMPATRP